MVVIHGVSSTVSLFHDMTFAQKLSELFRWDSAAPDPLRATVQTARNRQVSGMTSAEEAELCGTSRPQRGHRWAWFLRIR